MNVKHTSVCIFEFYFTRKIIQTIQIVLRRAKFRGKMKNYFVIVFAEIFQFGTTSKSNREAKIIFSSCFSQSLGSCSSCSGFRLCRERERERKKMVTSHLFHFIAKSYLLQLDKGLNHKKRFYLNGMSVKYLFKICCCCCSCGGVVV